MTRAKPAAIALALALLTTSGGAPVAGAAGPVEPPVIVDPPGDANGLNGAVIAEGPDTRPASDDRADLLRIWPETTYEVVRERDGAGNVLAVRHEPVALRINVETLAPARPATGPTLRFRLPVQAGGCYFKFRFFVRGPLSQPDDEPEIVQLVDIGPEDELVSVNPSPGCLGGIVGSPAFVLGSDGTVTWMEFPFDALATIGGGLLAPGTQLEANGTPNIWARTGGVLVGGPLDVAHPLPHPYVIGSDVPADIDCGQTPQEPTCQS